MHVTDIGAQHRYNSCACVSSCICKCAWPLYAYGGQMATSSVNFHFLLCWRQGYFMMEMPGYLAYEVSGSLWFPPPICLNTGIANLFTIMPNYIWILVIQIQLHRVVWQICNLQNHILGPKFYYRYNT